MGTKLGLTHESMIMAKKVLRGTYGPKRWGETGGRRTRIFTILYSSLIRVELSNRCGGVVGDTQVRKKQNAFKIGSGGNFKTVLCRS